MKIQVHYTLTGLLGPLSATLEVNPGYSDADLKAGVMTQVVDCGIKIDGKVPKVKEIFFVKELGDAL